LRTAIDIPVRVRVQPGARIIRASFFRRDPVTCARELIGTELMWETCSGIIVETEAYFAENDEACHTFNRPSACNFIERNKAGAAYIYFTYGAHWMLNVLVKGSAHGFVLIRALEPVRGIALMKKRRGLNEERQLCSGPGKLTQALAITARHHEIDLCSDPQHHFSPCKQKYVNVVADARIGITRSMHRPWRFTLRDSRFVSVPVRAEARSRR
jgi:DNA-3-methyladenine glycosylase